MYEYQASEGPMMMMDNNQSDGPMVVEYQTSKPMMMMNNQNAPSVMEYQPSTTGSMMMQNNAPRTVMMQNNAPQRPMVMQAKSATGPMMMQTNPQMMQTNPKMMQKNPQMMQTNPQMMQTNPQMMQTKPNTMMMIKKKSAKPMMMGASGPMMMDSNVEYKHKTGRIVALVAVCLLFAVTALFNGLSGLGAENSGGLFASTTGDVSDKYYIEITPSGWTFSIWGVIYGWQVLWIAYGISTFCRKGFGGYLYYAPDFMPVSLYVVYCFNLVFNTAWIFVWDREVLIASPIILWLIAITLYTCLVISYRALYKSIPILAQNGRMVEVWLVRAFVHNGLACYAAWVTIASLLNVSITATYVGGFPQEDSSTLALALLGAIVPLYFYTDAFAFDKYTRYTVSPLIVVMWALGGSLDQNFVAWNRNTIFTMTLMGVTVLHFLFKIVIVIFRHIRKPIVGDTDAMQKFEQVMPGTLMPINGNVMPMNGNVMPMNGNVMPMNGNVMTMNGNVPMNGQMMQTLPMSNQQGMMPGKGCYVYVQ